MEYSPEEWRGTASIEPTDRVEAGTMGTWTVRYRTGIAGIDEGGRLRLSWRSVSDWPAPQFDRPKDANFVSIRTSGNSTLVPSFGVTGVRPWSKALTIRVVEEALAPGDEVVIVLGDTSGGGPGMRAQTHPEYPFRFKFDVDPFGTALFEAVTAFELQIIGDSAQQLHVVAPSDAVSGAPFRVQVRALDRWGNPDPSYRGTISFISDAADGLPDTYTFVERDEGVHWFDGVRMDGSGIERIEVQDADNGFRSTSNPIEVRDSAPQIQRYWGDIHGQTEETVGTGTIPGFFKYARDIAGIQVAAHQGNDFQITPELWDELCERVEEYNDPGHFVTFHGYEWSGNTTAGGDHNVYLKEPRTPQRSSHTQIEDKRDEDEDRYPITRLHESNRDRDDMLIVPHIGGRRADIQWHEPALEPAIEIASQWGRFEWFAKEALERGYKVGFTGGSDDHSARQGWSSPTLAHHGVRGGLTAFLAPELSRDAIWDALKSRRLYGTSGPRILIDLDVNGHPIGSECELSDLPRVQARVVGTDAIDTVELRRGAETLHAVSGLPEPEADEPTRIRVAWRGARNRGRSRALDWGGELRVWNGTVTAVENHAVDNPLEGIQQWNPGRIVWESHTCGDWDGIILDVEADDDTLFDFRTPTMSFRFTLDDIRAGQLRKTGQLLEQQVVVRRLSHQPGVSELALDWQDENPSRGINPYWLWITQADGELAWTSPVYVDWRG
ncbi:MAG: DUF3604 domain-containing protein [Thermomicrobiales bacterium]